MNSVEKRLLSVGCAVAIAVNGVAGVMAQDGKAEGKAVSVQTEPRPVAVIATLGADAANAVFRAPDGGGAVHSYNSGQQGGDNAFQFFSQEISFDNRLVKGAPFSADTVSETIQTLTDGNRIVQRSEGRIYRDSQGRTRNERTFQIGGSSEQSQTINIFDPVNNVNYILDPASKTARKSNTLAGTFARVSPTFAQTTPPASASANLEHPKKISVSGGVLQGSAVKKVQPQYPPIAKAAKASGAVQVQILINEIGEVIEASVVSGHPLLRDAALLAARQWVFKPTELSGKPVKVLGILTFNFTLSDEEPTPAAPARSIPKYTTNTEQLGKQTIEGVECEGTRSITTMPAGAIGNERPIETVVENWYSPELKMMILTKRNDPRFGESTYRVTNVSRAEPDAQLFLVPSDYMVKDGGAGRIGSISGFGEEYERQFEEVRKKLQEARRPDNQ
jgi:TonB family protein